jgi:hypothetical protein
MRPQSAERLAEDIKNEVHGESPDYTESPQTRPVVVFPSRDGPRSGGPIGPPREAKRAPEPGSLQRARATPRSVRSLRG